MSVTIDCSSTSRRSLITWWRAGAPCSMSPLTCCYDLTSTYFESDPPFGQEDKRRFGYSRDRRSDCVQVVIALVVTPEGLPLAYEVLAGNTQDKATLRDFLARIERQYGKARRIWVMDRGIPTEEVLQEMRDSDPPTQYLVGTPKRQAAEQVEGVIPPGEHRRRIDIERKHRHDEPRGDVLG